MWTMQIIKCHITYIIMLIVITTHDIVNFNSHNFLMLTISCSRRPFTQQHIIQDLVF